MTAKEFLFRYDNGEEFSESELQHLFWGDLEAEEGDDIQQIDEEYDEPRRWTRNHTIWIKVNERYFELNADEGLTELQDTSYWRQPQEVRLNRVTRTIVVTENEWTYVEEKER